MDEFKKVSWKRIQQIVNKYTGQSNPPKITPIFAHAPDAPVALTGSFSDFADLLMGKDALYSYASTLIEKDGEYKASTQAFLQSPEGEYPILHEEETFSKDRSEEVKDYIRLPFSYFKKGRGVRAMTFENSDMFEEDFENLIELWRTAPPQT